VFFSPFSFYDLFLDFVITSHHISFLYMPRDLVHMIYDVSCPCHFIIFLQRSGDNMSHIFPFYYFSTVYRNMFLQWHLLILCGVCPHICVSSTNECLN